MKKRNLKTAGLLCALVLVCLGLTAALASTAQSEPAILGGVPDPDDTVALFFDSLCAGELEQCDSLLYGYSSLGLDSQPQTAIGSALMDAVAASYSWQEAVPCTVDGINARCEILLTCLDTSAMTDDVRALAGEKLERFAAEAVSNDSLYNEDGSYREDVIMQLLEQAVADALLNAQQYYVSNQIEVSLSYIDGGWRVVLTDELIAAITGNLVSMRGDGI